MRKTTWTVEDGRRLAAARRRRGHSQQACASELEGLGATTASQGSVSNWEVGRTGPTSDETLEAIATYCEAAGCVEANVQTSTEESGSAAFEDVVAQLVGSRPLSDRQARLIDAVLTRLASGPPLSPDDGTALRFVAGVLGL